MADPISDAQAVRRFIRDALLKHNFDVSCAIIELTEGEAATFQGYAVLFGGTSDITAALPEVTGLTKSALTELQGKGVVFAYFDDLSWKRVRGVPVFDSIVNAQMAVARMFEFVDHEKFHLETGTECEDFDTDDPGLAHVIEKVMKQLADGDFRGKTDD